MNAVWALWVLFRVGRWAAWLGLLAYTFNVIFYREIHISPYGNVLLSTELKIFGLAFAGVIFGFLELMMREKVGVPRPLFLRDWLPYNRKSFGNDDPLESARS
jgi:hypothetical protein